jgi:UDP-2,3-diacylglucosamine pyrophosphatase LpxH
MKTLVLSDLHLGSPVCRADAILKLLSQPWEKIIINGDLLDSGNYGRYKKKHWAILEHLRKISKDIPVILIEGNHDEESSALCKALGLEFVQSLDLQYGDRKIHIEHGHRFDTFMGNHPFITWLASSVYYLIQLLDFTKKSAGYIKLASKAWVDAAHAVSSRAIAFAVASGYTDIVCGHVHIASNRHWGDVTYWNTGSFCESPSYYLTILGDRISLEKI